MKNVTVGVDWGSSSFRATRFDTRGEIIDQIESTDGIKNVSDTEFEQVLLSHIGEWASSEDTVLLSGMITSRDGWVETPYVECPFELSQLSQQAIRRTVGNNITALFLPGARVLAPADVMRGEELQLYGAAQNALQVVVLPGTHSKWALVNNGVLEKFHTVITGELFDVLINHALVGGLACSRDYIESAFLQGVETGHNTVTIVSELFTARAGVLLGELGAAEVYSWLSGLLIGNEIRESTHRFATDASIVIAGSGLLTARYAKAFDLLGFSVVAESLDAAALGFQKLITQEG